MVLADDTRFDLSPPVGRRSFKVGEVGGGVLLELTSPFKQFNPAVEQLVVSLSG